MLLVAAEPWPTPERLANYLAAVELWERRLLYWPPSNARRELFLFRYAYAGRKVRGVGLVGSVTFSMSGRDAPSPDEPLKMRSPHIA